MLVPDGATLTRHDYSEDGMKITRAAAAVLVVLLGVLLPTACMSEPDPAVEPEPPALTLPSPSPTAVPGDTPPPVPRGYRLVHRFDLSRDEGWTREYGSPNNAEATDRPENIHFGQGPRGTSMLIEGNRDEPGGPFFTGDALARFQPIPNYHRTYAVVEFDPMTRGMWPALWKRPLFGEGEIDDWEKMGGHLGQTNEDLATLHTTPYDFTHEQASRDLPTLGPGRHVIETELAPGRFTWWVDGRFAARITRAEFDQEVGRPAWDEMFGQSSKQWYARATLQAGGPYAGPIPPKLNRWRYWIHALEVYRPTR